MLRKIVTYLALILLITGSSCSISRKASGIVDKPGNNNDLVNIKKRVLKNNISEKSFIISKFKANINSKQYGDRSVNGFLKYDKEGKILISLRSMVGIEVARILVNSDSIKIYDKINKILYHQNVQYVERKFGLKISEMKLLWGDLPANDEISFEKENQMTVSKYPEISRKIAYSIDSLYYKIATVEAIRDKEVLIRATYEEYSKAEKFIYPGRVNIELGGHDMTIDMQIKAISFSDINNMNFKVDSNSKRVILR